MSNPVKVGPVAVADEYRIENATGKTRTAHKGAIVREMAVAVFDPSSNTSERAVGAHGLGVYLPDNAIITNAWYDVITTVTTASTDSGTIALHVQSAGDLVAAIAVSNASNVWDAGVHGTLVSAPNLGADAAHDTALEVIALYAALPIKMTAEREITATVAVAALLTGKVRIFVEYVISE